jgi:hypothetical protein
MRMDDRSKIEVKVNDGGRWSSDGMTLLLGRR